jgi:NAD(P)-dependent dehydrogenase (short-subunit alcohol dehydrogenase family)
MGTVTDRPFAGITGTASGLGLELANRCAVNGFDVLVKNRLNGLADGLLPETVKAKQVAKASGPGSGEH